ncbi:hypothetical protein [Pedobacter steynii]
MRRPLKVLDQIFMNTDYNYKLLSNNLIVIKSRLTEDDDIDSIMTLNEVIVTALNIKREQENWLFGINY